MPPKFETGDREKDELESLKSKRHYTRQKCTRKCNAVESQVRNLSLIECEENLNCLRRFSEDLTNMDTSIGNLIIKLEGKKIKFRNGGG